MFLRAFAFLLVLALGWAGIAMHNDTAVHAAIGGEPVCVASSGTPEAPEGWGVDHPMDGQPAQSQAETLADQPGLIHVGPDAQPLALVTTRPAPYAEAALTPPYLDGPQRPPCRATTAVA